MNSIGVLDCLFQKYHAYDVCKGDSVLRAGERNCSLLLLESGYVRTHLVNKVGWEFTINILASGSVFPLTQVLSGMETNPHEFRALTNVKIRKAPIETVMKFMDANPRLYSGYAVKFASGIEGMVKRLEHLVRIDGSQRVISALDLMAKKFGVRNEDGSIVISFPHTHQDIADIAGVTRETACREFQKLFREGIISHDRQRTIIRKPDVLNELLTSESLPQAICGL